MKHLFDTTDYREWLSETLTERNRSRRDLAKAVGRSPAWASQVLSGERTLDPDLVDPIAKFLRLTAEETSYLAALLDLESRSPRARRSAWATVQAVWRHRASPDLSEEYHRHISTWYVGAVLELSSCDGFRPDPAWIGRTLVPAITTEQAEEALTTLVRLGMLIPDEQRGLVRVDAHVVSPPGLDHLEAGYAARRMHASYLAIASDAMFSAHWTERRVSQAVMALSEETTPKMLSRLAEIEQELIQLSIDQTGTPNRLYSLAFQLVPLSHYTDSTHLEDHD